MCPVTPRQSSPAIPEADARRPRFDEERPADRDQDEDDHVDGDRAAEPGHPGRQGQAHAGDRRAVGEHLADDQAGATMRSTSPEAPGRHRREPREGGARRPRSRSAIAGRSASQSTIAIGPQPLAPDDRPGGQWGGQRTSRLPRTRSSASEVGAWTLTIIRPKRNCRCRAMISAKGPVGPPMP